jgi:hypothetical protein
MGFRRHRVIGLAARNLVTSAMYPELPDGSAYDPGTSPTGVIYAGVIRWDS